MLGQLLLSTGAVSTIPSILSGPAFLNCTQLINGKLSLMNSKYQQFYNEMIDALEVCKNKNCDFMKELECSYQICHSFWEEIKLWVEHFSFSSKPEEIEFFKYLKPAVTAEIEFYGLIYQCELFKPADTEGLLPFYYREAKRYARFLKDNMDFYNYYKSGTADKDEEYFCRIDEDHINYNRVKIYDIYHCVVSKYDCQITGYISLRKYCVYLKVQIKKLRIK